MNRFKPYSRSGKDVCWQVIVMVSINHTLESGGRRECGVEAGESVVGMLILQCVVTLTRATAGAMCQSMMRTTELWSAAVRTY